MMTVCVILSMIFIAAYTAAVCVKQRGIPESISATFYKLDHKYWFMATMWLTAGLLMPAILEASRPDTEWVAFIACFGMMLVGAAPNFRSSFEGGVHKAGAILCITGSQIWAGINNPWALLVWAVWLSGTSYCMVRRKSDSIVSDFLYAKPMFWIEIAALTSTYLSLFILA